MPTQVVCPACDAKEHGRPLSFMGPEGEVKLKHIPTTPIPTIEQLERWMSEGGCEATDGCWVEPDGKCEHRHSSWMLRMGLI